MLSYQPPAGAPPGPPGPAAGTKWWQSRLLLLLALLLILALVVSIVLVTTGVLGNRSSQSGEIALQPVASTGSDPFTSSVTSAALPSPSPRAASAPTQPGSGQVAVQTSLGSTPGLYGGTNQLGSCNPQQLVAYLTQNPSKATAWVTALNSDPGLSWSGGNRVRTDQIGQYVGELTPVVLRYDTRVTNHGYVDGSPTPFQSVLQAGTAVMVDRYGIPRVRCACGNPLTPALLVQTTPRYAGPAWPGFSPTTVVIIKPPPVIIDVFVLVNVQTGGTIRRPAGTAGGSDTTSPEPPGTSRPSPSPSAPPSPSCGQPSVITGSGSASASSTYPGGAYPVSAAVDGNRGTSWFSAGNRDPNGDNSIFTWTAGTPALICSISVLSNAQNSDASTRQGFTFTSVTVQLLDSNGAVLNSQDQPMGDQDVQVGYGSGGVSNVTTVKLVLHHHTDPRCGGFSELVINGVAG